MRRTAAVASLCGVLAVFMGCGGPNTPPKGPAPRTSSAPRGAQTGNDRTGAIDSLPASQMDEQHYEDIAEFLQSRVPGLRVIRAANGDISLQIRGGDMSFHGESDGTVTAESAGEPLLVVNGMPVNEGQVSNTLRALNPHEVANIQVLKDVSSTSVYGMRGAHGVILITMKKRD